MTSIQEVRSPFVDQTSDPLHPRLSFAEGLGFLGGGVLLFPIFVGGAVRKGLGPGGVRGFPLAFFLALAETMLVLASLHYRYSNLLSVPVGLGAGLLLSREGGGRGAGSRSWGKAGEALRLVAVAAACLPGLSFAVEHLRNPLAEATWLGSRSTMAWIAARTPEPSDPFDLRKAPEYGVLAPMDLGNAVIVEGRRPGMATGSVHGTLGGELLRVAGALTETDPSRLRAFMEENRLRYLLLPSDPGFLLQEYFVLGRDDPAALLRREGSSALYSAGKAPVSLRLCENLGGATDKGGRPLPSSDHFRLVFEGASPTGLGKLAVERYLVFGAVRGASLEGKAPPGAWVVASLPLDTPLRREVWWEDLAQAGPDGRFRMTVPYPTGPTGGEVRPRGLYEVRVGRAGPVRTVAVPEDAVRRGLAIQVP